MRAPGFAATSAIFFVSGALVGPLIMAVPERFLPHLANGMVDPYGGILLLLAALGSGLVASFFCSALRGGGSSSRKPRTPVRVLGEGVAFFACNFLGYVASSLVLGLLSGAFARG